MDLLLRELDAQPCEAAGEPGAPEPAGGAAAQAADAGVELGTADESTS